VIEFAAMVLRPGGMLFLEIGESQAEGVSALLAEAGFEAVEVRKDLAGRDRVVSAVLTDEP
jgi:release factor glutamine methyltransferase